MNLPSRRALLIGLGGAVVASVAAAGLWLWVSMAQREAMTAYATALVAAQDARAPQAKPESRSEAIRHLESALSRYPSGEAAAQASLELGSLRYASGAYEAARAAWQVAATRASASPTLRTLAQAGIAQAWEAEGQYAKAAEAYQSAVAGRAPADFLFEQLLHGLARCQELSGKKEAAVATYRRLLAEVPEARLGEEIRARLLALDAS